MNRPAQTLPTDDNPRIAARFERFQPQVANQDAGDEEATFFGADFTRALAYGRALTGVIGIARWMKGVTDGPSIRDVILFPALRRGA